MNETPKEGAEAPQPENPSALVIVPESRVLFLLAGEMGGPVVPSTPEEGAAILQELLVHRKSLNVLKAAGLALRSFEYGNAATEFAKEMADDVEKRLAVFGLTLLGGAPSGVAS